MKLVELTLYEIFGYVFPGAAAVAGIYLVYWTFLLPADQDWSTLSSGGWTALLAVAYVFGHFIQAITNLILKKSDWRPECSVFDEESLAIRTALNEKVRKIIGLGQEENLGAKVVYNIADHTVLQRGKTETRDIYVYREGFYRGMSLGLLLLAVGCFVRIIGPEASLKMFGIILAITNWMIFCIGFIAVVMMVFSYRRYRRFASYRVRYALYSFLVMGDTAGDESDL